MHDKIAIYDGQVVQAGSLDGTEMEARTRPMGQDYTEEVETQLAIEILNLFQRERLTAPQAKSLLEKVRVLVAAGEKGLFNTQH